MSKWLIGVFVYKRNQNCSRYIFWYCDKRDWKKRTFFVLNLEIFSIINCRCCIVSWKCSINWEWEKMSFLPVRISLILDTLDIDVNFGEFLINCIAIIDHKIKCPRVIIIILDINHWYQPFIIHKIII